MRWWQHLDRLKRLEGPQSLFLVTTDEIMQRAIAAWPAVSGHPPEDVVQFEMDDDWPMEALHSTLWGVRYPLEQASDRYATLQDPDGPQYAPPIDNWARSAGLAVMRHEDTLWRAIEHSLVYPDGTIHGTVLGWLTTRAVNAAK